MIAVAVFKEANVGILSVHITAYAFQTTKQQCLPHHSQIRAQRIHQFHCCFRRIFVKFRVIRCLGERVVHYFIKSTTNKLLCDNILQMVFAVFGSLNCERTLELRGNFHIVVAINPQYVFHDITRTLHVYTICWDNEVQAVLIFCLNAAPFKASSVVSFFVSSSTVKYTLA